MCHVQIFQSTSASAGTLACSRGRIVSWIIYCWLVWCERKTLFPTENLRSFTIKRTGWHLKKVHFIGPGPGHVYSFFFLLLKTRSFYFLSISQNFVVSWCFQSIDCTITKLCMSHVCASCNLNRIWSSIHTALRSRVLAGRSRAVAICVICRVHADQQVAAALTASNTCLITRRPPVC